MEIALLLPLMVILLGNLSRIWGLIVGLFIVVLILGTFYEWKEGTLDWKD